VALVLLLTVVAVPAWWGALQNVVGSGVVMAAVAVVLVVTAFWLGATAVLAGRDRSVVLQVVMVLAAVVALAAVMVAIGFAFGENG
jgi:hypothetical protein